MGFGSFGLGIKNRETMKIGNGIGIWAKCTLGRWDLSKIWAREMRFVFPPPPFPLRPSVQNHVQILLQGMMSRYFARPVVRAPGHTIYPHMNFPP